MTDLPTTEEDGELNTETDTGEELRDGAKLLFDAGSAITIAAVFSAVAAGVLTWATSSAYGPGSEPAQVAVLAGGVIVSALVAVAGILFGAMFLTRR